MANQPHPSRQAVTWRLTRALVDRVKARAAENGETVLALVTRALEREVEHCSAGITDDPGLTRARGEQQDSYSS